jgi:hypothetical protein
MQLRAAKQARRGAQAAIMLIVIVAIVAMPPKATMPTTSARPAKTLLSMTLTRPNHRCDGAIGK